MSQCISKHTRVCVNSNITRTKVDGIIPKPSKCGVNRVKVVLNRTRPDQTVLGIGKQSYKNRMQIVFKL